LAARLPLCAELDNFVPCIATLLCQYGITSILVAADERADAVHSLGLLPMADLILRFTAATDDDTKWLDAKLGAKPAQLARLTATRVPAGGIGGQHGFVYRNPEPSGLQFIAGQ
jgi:hypothetical protein